MDGNLGREAELLKNNVVLAGVRTKSFSWGGESVDLSASDDDGLRVLSEKSGQEQIDISLEGIARDDTLKSIALVRATSKMLTDIVLSFDIRNPANTTKATLSGNFKLSSYEEGMPYNEGITFSASLESSGEWVYTPESA